MVKHTQKICRQNPANCLSVFDHFLGLVLKGLRWSFYRKQLTVESTLVLHPTVFAYLDYIAFKNWNFQLQQEKSL